MDNKERFIEIFTSQIHRPGAAELLEWLESTDFFEAPASTHYHGSYPGGLVEHSLNVYYELTDAEALAIRWHMGAYDDAAKGGSKVLSAAMAATPLVYALHAADMRAEQKENAQP